MEYYIGLDIGTTSTKAIIYNPSGEVKARSGSDYPLLVPHPSWAEQSPDTIFQAVIQALRDVIEKSGIQACEIGAIGISSAMHSMIAVDMDGNPLTNVIIWADNRSAAQTERLKQSGLGHSIYLETGTPIHSMSPLTKLIWMRDEAPITFAASAKFISIKEYVLFRFYGEYVVDYSIASATGLFNLKKLQWDDRALQIAGIRADQLSALVPTTHILTGMKEDYAAAIGIHRDLPVVIGASDGALANLGVGAITPGQVSLTVGTSGAIRRVMPEPVLDSQGRTFCYYLTDHHWVIGGPTNNGGVALQWFINQFCTGESVDDVINSARDIKAGAEGLLFLPFLLGERAPYWNPDVRGNFFGIALQHQKAHFARAVLEGVMFSLYSVGKVLSELTEEITEIRAAGGFARSDLWTNILADIFGSTVLNPASHEGSSIGAAMLAMLAIGKVNSLEEAASVIEIKRRIEHNPLHHEIYQELHGIYARIYTKLEEEFKLISEYQKKI